MANIRDPAIPLTLGAFRALQDEVRRLDAELADQDRLLRASVPDRWKGCTSPVGAAQSYIAELEQKLESAEYMARGADA